MNKEEIESKLNEYEDWSCNMNRTIEQAYKNCKESLESRLYRRDNNLLSLEDYSNFLHILKSIINEYNTTITACENRILFIQQEINKWRAELSKFDSLEE